MRKYFGSTVSAVSLSLLFIVGLCIPNGGAQAATKKEINASVDVALERFATDVKGADAFLKAAKGVLVVPRVKQAGFVIGAKYGNGALRVEGKTIGYYNITAGSAGPSRSHLLSEYTFLSKHRFIPSEVKLSFV